MRQPVDSALDVLQGIVEQVGSGREVPAVEEVMAALRDFAQIEFEVPDGQDADGFLFQYGTYDWFSAPTFTVNFVRQLEIVDIDGEHDGYLQVQLEYRYGVDADLTLLSRHGSWWFTGGRFVFDEWLELVGRDPVWEIIREKIPREFDMSQELV